MIFGVNRFIRNLLIDGGTDVTYFTLYMIVNIGAVLIQILMRKKQDTPPGEMAVLILSDPILWWAIYYFAFYMEIFFLF